MFVPVVPAILTRNKRHFGIGAGDRIFGGCKIFLFCTNLIKSAQISPKFAQISPESNQICPNLINLIFAFHRSFDFATWLNSPHVDCWRKLVQLWFSPELMTASSLVCVCVGGECLSYPNSTKRIFICDVTEEFYA